MLESCNSSFFHYPVGKGKDGKGRTNQQNILRFFQDTCLKEGYLDISQFQLPGFHRQCSQGLRSYSHNKRKKNYQLKFKQVFSGLATFTDRMLFIFFFLFFFLNPIPSKNQKNTNMLFCYRVSSLLFCFWVSKENVTRKELK